jgi:hypothetical protein
VLSPFKLSCLLLLLDSFGKTDEREPLTNAVRSDSAVIGGKPFFLVASKKDIYVRKDVYDPLLLEKLSEIFFTYCHPVPRAHIICQTVSLSMIVHDQRHPLPLCQRLCGFILPLIYQAAEH